MDEQIKKLIEKSSEIDIEFMLSEALSELKSINTHLSKILEAE